MNEDTDTEEVIRQRAYEMWQEAGMPHGVHDDFWHQAKAELNSGQKTDTAPPVKSASFGDLKVEELARATASQKR